MSSLVDTGGAWYSEKRRAREKREGHSLIKTHTIVVNATTSDVCIVPVAILAVQIYTCVHIHITKDSVLSQQKTSV
jgi:hypothetical protein